MSNVIARSFLSDESIEQLENSEGAKNVVAKQKRIDGLKRTEMDSRVNLELLYRTSSELNREIFELNKLGFFKRLLRGKEIDEQIQELTGKLRILESDIDATIEKIELTEKIIKKLEAELARYSAELAKVGLSLEDIVREYNLIKQELEQRAKSPKTTPQTPVQKQQPKRMTQTEKFNLRVAKQLQMQAERNKQPGEE